MQLGRVGIWSSGLRRLPDDEVATAARELEELGYGALWIPSGGPVPILERARTLLAATSHIKVATGILNIWEHSPADVAADTYAIETDYPGRFLLGLGVSHGHERTYGAMTEFLDGLDQAPHPVPASNRVLAALGPRMLKLARDRAAGAHPYNVLPSHTWQARATLGPGPLLAPEQGAVLETDPAKARDIARQFLATYLKLPNYTNNLLRDGFTPADFENGGSDRLVDTVIAWGDVSTVMDRVEDHLAAGADHVCVQVLTTDRSALPRAEWRRLATALNKPINRPLSS